jgi:pimeloyl-ACP methyl ester carboxylesterase
MLANSLAPMLHGALGRTASQVDETLIRLALATSRRKGRRIRELSQRRRYYEQMGDRYAALDQAEFYARPPSMRPLRERILQKVPGGAIVDLQWSSGYEPRLPSARDAFVRWRENKTAHARVFRHDRAPLGAVMWIHGYRGGPLAIEQRIARAEELFEAGLDVAMYVMPFHGARAPARSVAPLFPSQGSIERTNEGFGQVIWELRSLAGWLRNRGTTAVGVAGMSLGGYCASLLATVDPEIAFAVPFIPLADFTDAVVAHETLRGIVIDDELQAASRYALQIHRPLARTPAVPSDRVLVIGAEADRITGRLHAELLANHFGAELAWFRGGHIFQYGRADGFRALAQFARHKSSAPPPPSSSQLEELEALDRVERAERQAGE